MVDAAHPDEQDWKKKYVGVVDMIKMVVVMQNALEASSPILEESNEKDEPADMRTLIFHPLSSAFAERPLSEMTESEQGWFPFMPIEQDSNLLDAIVLLGSIGLKRLPVISGPGGDIVNILTQSSIVHLLAERCEELTVVTSLTLEELGMADPKPIYSIRASQPVKDAFRLIREHNISAVPVLGTAGEMVGGRGMADSIFHRCGVHLTSSFNL